MSARILYIEDNRQNMRLVRKMLASQGYEVLEASEGMIGIEVALAEQPNLILVDINLPDIDGMEVTERLKSEAVTQHIPIIALTANAMYGDRERFLDAGCDGYLAKPISKSELVKTVQEFLGTPE
jgi:two-component system cell cycle response regulator DivK